MATISVADSEKVFWQDPIFWIGLATLAGIICLLRRREPQIAVTQPAKSNLFRQEKVFDKQQISSPHDLVAYLKSKNLDPGVYILSLDSKDNIIDLRRVSKNNTSSCGDVIREAVQINSTAFMMVRVLTGDVGTEPTEVEKHLSDDLKSIGNLNGSTDVLTFTNAVGYTFDAVVRPSSNDAAALGSATVSWSDLFLASGAVINFNNGDVTITHSSNALNIGGGNVGIGTGTFGTNAATVLGIANGTVPSTSPANMIQVYSKDSSDGATNATLAVRTEQAVEIIGTFTASHKLKIWLNEVEYWVQLDAV